MIGWKKEGNSYISVSDEQAIQALALDGNELLTITAKNSDIYLAILQITSDLHCVYPMPAQNRFDCYSSNFNDLKQFINVLLPYYPELEEIKSEIFEYLDTEALPVTDAELSAIYENPTPTTPPPSLGHALNAVADNTDPPATLNLNGWLTSTMVSLAMASEAQASLVQASSIIMSSALLSPLLLFSPFVASEAMRVTAQSMNFPTFNPSTNILFNVIDQRIAELEANGSSTTTTTISHSSAPAPGKNADRLKALELPDEEADKIPNQFLCALTYHMMTEPVSAPGLPPVDKANILHALKRKPVNPFNNTPLQAHQLQAETELQAEIEAYLSKAEEEKQAKEKQAKEKQKKVSP